MPLSYYPTPTESTGFTSTSSLVNLLTLSGLLELYRVAKCPLSLLNSLCRAHLCSKMGWVCQDITVGLGLRWALLSQEGVAFESRHHHFGRRHHLTGFHGPPSPTPPQSWPSPDPVLRKDGAAEITSHLVSLKGDLARPLRAANLTLPNDTSRATPQPGASPHQRRHLPKPSNTSGVRYWFPALRVTVDIDRAAS